MPPVGFESTISAGERPQIYALDRAATGTGKPGYNDIDLCRTSFITSDIPRYQLIPRS